MRTRGFLRRTSAALAVSVALSLLATACSGGDATAGASPSAGKAGKSGEKDGEEAGGKESAGIALPPAHSGFDYQLGAPYPPPAGVSVVARDHTERPAPGIYNICYVNAFQAQPGAEKEWDADLLLRDGAGEVVMDEEWGEAMLDVRTPDKRERIARKVNTWIDACAAKGYRAVDPDNYDSYTRAPRGLLTADDAKAFLSLLAAHAHAKGLAIGQKNTAELAPSRKEVGADFAVVEECGQYDECGDYTAAFGDHVLVIEYTGQGMERACEGWGDRIDVVRRDLDLVARGDEGYRYETCDGIG
ncbi:endo alpha-1,4 polygalactosaminidase [Streptomyces sp. NPDC002559]